MAEGTYEFEVMRAELLGVEPLDRTVFEEKQRERLAAEQDQIDMEQTKVRLRIVLVPSNINHPPESKNNSRNWMQWRRKCKVVPGNWTNSIRS